MISVSQPNGNELSLPETREHVCQEIGGEQNPTKHKVIGRLGTNLSTKRFASNAQRVVLIVEAHSLEVSRALAILPVVTIKLLGIWNAQILCTLNDKLDNDFLL